MPRAGAPGRKLLGRKPLGWRRGGSCVIPLGSGRLIAPGTDLYPSPEGRERGRLGEGGGAEEGLFKDNS